MPALVPFRTVPDLFKNLVAHYDGSDRAALSYKDKQSKQWIDITWNELYDRVMNVAAYLHSRGVRKGDRVAILSENRPEWAIVDLATQWLGGINVSLYTSLPASQVEYIVRDSGSILLFVSTSIQLRKAEECLKGTTDLKEVVTMSEVRSDRGERVRQWDDVVAEGAAYRADHEAELQKAAESVTPDDLSALIYTSGTTGEPKGVMLTHNNFSSNVMSALEVVSFGPDDHHLSFLPLCHSFERTGGYLAVMTCGARISYAESIDTVSRNLLEVHPTVMISVPVLFERVYNTIRRNVEEGPALKKRIFEWSVATGRKAAEARKNGMLSPLLKGQEKLAHKLVFSKLHERLGGNLRFAVSGGAALSKEVGEFFEAAGIVIVEGYGLTETSPIVSASPMDNPRYGAVGHIIPGVTVAIQSLDDQRILGKLSGEDYPSKLSTPEGEILVKGPNVMKGYWNQEEATSEAIDDEGWYHTGDVGRFVDGYLMITDRIKHMIVSAGGKNIYPGPIEDRLKSNPLIDQIVVIGEGRDYLTALVVPNLDALKQLATEQGASFSSDEELLKSDAILAQFDSDFKSYSRTAAAPEKVRGFRLLSEPFTTDNNLLTPTLKPRRRQIEEQYRDLIEEMYGG